MSDKEVEVGVEAITNDDNNIPPPPQEEDMDDGSSIEALNWSDFSEDEMEAARLSAAREFPADGTNNVAAVVVVPEEPKSTIDSVTTTESEESTENVQDKIEDAMSVLSSKSSSQDEEEEEFQNLEYDGGKDATEDDDTEKGDAETEKIHEDVFGSMLSINSNISKEDSASNAPVLDDGPIWGKGEKLYRFHENRTINQKLTFGVLISVVLALGIGLGNLVAYQEYEGEQHHQHHHHHENSKIEQHFHHCPASRVPLTENTNDVPVVPNGFPSSTRINDQASVSDDLITQRTRTQDRYTIQQEDALAYVVKSLDELSKKLDHFENTTRQLSGIIVMSDEARFSASSAKKSAATEPEESSDDISSWDVPSDRPLTFSQVVHSDQDQEILQVEQLQTPLSKAELPVFHVPNNLNVLSTEEKNSEPTEASFPQESINPKSRRSKSQKKRQQADNFVPEHVQFHRKSKKEFKRERSPPKEVRHERSPPLEHNKKEWSPPREQKREGSPPREQRREGSPPQEQKNKREWSPPRGQRERSPARDDLRASGSPSRKQNKKREKSPAREESRPTPPPAHQKRGGKNGMENYPPHVIYLPENNYSNFEVKEKKWKSKNDYENSFDSFKSREKKQKHDDRNIIENPRRNEFLGGSPFPDWDLERAKLRESQRVQSNWDKDFRGAAERQRKRQQNWQIERDRVREKVRKGL